MDFYIKGNDGREIFVYCWDEVEKPMAVVQIFHGMAEHAGRYARFSQFLNDRGVVVYADDHRGHGKTAGSVDELGYIGEDGFNRIVEDEHILTCRIKELYPDIPVIIFGHSFGSFIAQDYITRYGSSIAGAVMSGSALMRGMEVSAGLGIAALQKSFSGDRVKSRFIESLSFGTYNRKINNAESKFAWLSRDEAEVRKYEDDPFCGTTFTAGFYYYFFKALSQLYKREKLMKVPKGLPVFIASGEHDAVGGYGEKVRELYEMYKGIGLKNVGIKLYEGCRHEILNEINRDEIFEDILNWIKHI